MPSIEKRLAKLEDAVIAHLTESGEIRRGMETLTQAVEKISDRMWGVVLLAVTTLLAVVGFLLKVTLWR